MQTALPQYIKVMFIKCLGLQGLIPKLKIVTNLFKAARKELDILSFYHFNQFWQNRNQGHFKQTTSSPDGIASHRCPAHDLAEHQACHPTKSSLHEQSDKRAYAKNKNKKRSQSAGLSFLMGLKTPPNAHKSNEFTSWRHACRHAAH